MTAFFVASEFAVVKIRGTRIDQLLAEGHPKAKAAKKVVSNMDEYLSACQLGITITSLGLGWLGEPTVEKMLHPLFERLHIQESLSHILSFIIAFSLITFLHVVVGELAPKTFAIQKAEAITLLFSPPLILFNKIMYPFIWLLNSAARLIVGLFGIQPASEHELAHSEEELRIILSESFKSGEINQSEFKYVNRIFEFDNRVAKEIMVPRMEMVCLSIDQNMNEIFKTIKEERYTRYPVIDGDKDNILGIVNSKEILTDCIMQKCKGEEPLTPYIKPVIRAMENIPIQDVLLRMQKDRSQMAILSDEYGGTAGLVTTEDILEEIVGEIRDEFDTDELPLIQKISKDHYILDGKVLITEVNDLLGTDLEEDDVDTIAGWFLTRKYEIHEGDSILADGFEFKIKELEGHHIWYLEVKKAKELD